jgi:hypothetical protein
MAGFEVTTEAIGVAVDGRGNTYVASQKKLGSMVRKLVLFWRLFSHTLP